MKEIIKAHYGVIIGICVVLFLVVIGSKSEGDDRRAHAAFMVANKCTIHILDRTLGREGCIDINDQIHWRKK